MYLRARFLHAGGQRTQWITVLYNIYMYIIHLHLSHTHKRQTRAPTNAAAAGRGGSNQVDTNVPSVSHKCRAPTETEESRKLNIIKVLRWLLTRHCLPAYLLSCPLTRSPSLSRSLFLSISHSLGDREYCQRGRQTWI